MAATIHSGSNQVANQASGNGVYTPQDYRQRAKELKRSRGDISCFECRRLKIRCDKKVPCSSCSRRRCEDICPNGPSMRIPAETDILRTKLGIANERIRLLEDALRKAHSRLSDTIHPLLEKSEKRQRATRSRALGASNLSSDSEDPGPVESFGTLAIADDGESLFLGPSAASETLIASDFRASNCDDSPGPSSGPSKLSREVLQASQMWPFTPAYLTRSDHQLLLEAHLPSYERASALCEAFLENLAFLHSPIMRPQIMEELLPLIYKRKRAGNHEETDRRVEIYDLALIFALFACGAAGDLTQTPDNEEGRTFYSLARAAMGIGSSRNSLSAVQALILMSLYLRFSWSSDELEDSWKILTIATGMAKSMGLHRDPGRWKLNPIIQERRRSVLLVLYLLDNYFALQSGRPPSLTSQSIDVKFPQKIKADSNLDEPKKKHENLFWKYEFLRRCLAPTAERSCGDVRPMRYQEVFELDRKISEYKAEETASREPLQPENQLLDTLLPIKRVFLQLNCDTLRLAIHRNFFARALLDHPENPLKSPFAPSFLSAYKIASNLLDETHKHTDINLQILLRIWPYWLHILVSGVVVGTVAARCPTLSLAPSAFASLETAISVFEKGAQHPVAANGLRIFGRLREKASRALSASHEHPLDQTSSIASGHPKVEENEDDELAVLRGDSRLVSQKTSPSPFNSGSNSRSTSSPAIELPRIAHSNTPKLTPENISTPLFESVSSQPISQLEAFPIDWTVMDLDAILSGTQAQEWLASSAIGSVVEDGSFAALEQEVFFTQPPFLDVPNTGYNNIVPDEWNSSNLFSGVNQGAEWTY